MPRRSQFALVAMLSVLLAALPVRTPEVRADEQPVDLKSLEQRLGEPLWAWRALWEAGEAGERAHPLVPLIVRHLEGPHPVARRLAAEALGKIGPLAREAEVPLLRAYRTGGALLDRAIELALPAIGPWVPVDAELPEAITFASTPCLRALAQASVQGFVHADELALLDRCRQEARRHAARIEADRLFRLGEQIGANVVGSLPSLPWLESETIWSPPFLLIALGERKPEASVEDAASSAEEPQSLRALIERAPRFNALLEGSAEVCQAVYRDVLARHGAALELRPLESPYGGRPDLPIHSRSFADGYPIPIWIFVGPGVRQRLARSAPRDFWLAGREMPEHVRAWFDHDGSGRASVVADEIQATRGPNAAGLVAWSVAAALEHAFERQRRSWRNAVGDDDSLRRAIICQWGSWERVESGRLARATGPWKRLVWRELASAAWRRGVRPWFALERLLAFESGNDAMQAAADLGFDPRVGGELAKAQAWAFSQFLVTHADLERRAQWEQLVARRLDGRLSPSDIRSVLRIRDDDDWHSLDKEFALWLDATFPPGAPAPPVAEPK